jgi:hypothetical protein
MMETRQRDTPTGLSPSADAPKEKQRRVVVGRGLAIFIAGVALAAFALYIFVVIYGIFAAT